MKYLDPDGREAGIPSEIEKILTTRGNNTENNSNTKALPCNVGSIDSFEGSLDGPEANGASTLWVSIVNDTTDGGELNLSVGVLSIDGETDTPVFFGGTFDVLDGSGQIALTNDGVSLSASASVISLSVRGGVKFDAAGRELRGAVAGSVGLQAGFQLTFDNDSLVIDAALIWGGRIEASWKEN